MKIKQATAADLTVVATLFNDYRQFYEQKSDLEAAEALILARMEKKESVIYVAMEDERPLGFVGSIRHFLQWACNARLF